MDSDQIDYAYEFFSQVIPSNGDESKAEIDRPRKILAKAFDLEITAPADISVSSSQQATIDKLLRDAAGVLKNSAGWSFDQKSNGWIFSTHIDDAEIPKSPMFSSGYDILTETTTGKEISPNEESTKKPLIVPITCFNCEGVHNVAECPEPKDQAKIRRNRMIYRQQQGSVGQNDPRFKKYCAGEISDGLRAALGIRDNELPPWIQDMRRLGYPPGYARLLLMPVTKLAVYDGSADFTKKAVSTLDFDSSLFVHYPGFNAPLPDGVVEEYENYEYPPMESSQMEGNFLESQQNGEKSDAGLREEPIEDFCSSPWGIEISGDEMAAAAASLSTNSSKRSSYRNESPSIEELKIEQKRIKNELAQLTGKAVSKQKRLDSDVSLATRGFDQSWLKLVKNDVFDSDSPPSDATPKRVSLSDSIGESPPNNIIGYATPSPQFSPSPTAIAINSSAKKRSLGYSDISLNSPQVENPASGRDYFRLKGILKKPKKE